MHTKYNNMGSKVRNQNCQLRGCMRPYKLQIKVDCDLHVDQGFVQGPNVT